MVKGFSTDMLFGGQDWLFWTIIEMIMHKPMQIMGVSWIHMQPSKSQELSYQG